MGNPNLRSLPSMTSSLADLPSVLRMGINSLCGDAVIRVVVALCIHGGELNVLVPPCVLCPWEIWWGQKCTVATRSRTST